MLDFDDAFQGSGQFSRYILPSLLKEIRVLGLPIWETLVEDQIKIDYKVTLVHTNIDKNIH